MAARFAFVLCASALLVQSIAAYPGSCGCDGWNGWDASIAAAEITGAEIAAAGNYGGYGYAAPAYGLGSIYTGPAIASASGGSFGVSVASPYTPSGISVVSENSIDGALEVLGSLPVLATVSLEGAVPSSGAAGTSYSCGSGDVGISSESLAAAGLGAGRARLAGSAGYGLGAAIAGAERAGVSAGLAEARMIRPRPSCGCRNY